MSFFKKLKDNEDTDFNEENNLEEQYQKMFKKIARDFVHKDDLKEILIDILYSLDIESEVNKFPVKAFMKAKEYEKNLNTSLTKRKKYLDIDEYPFFIPGDEDER
jgi:hypothetical protein